MKNKTKTKSSEVIAPNPLYAPFINSAAGTFQPGYEQSRALTEQLLPRATGALDYYGRTMGGEYLNGNPYLDSVIRRASEDVTTGVNSQFEGAGRYGSGAHAGVLARALGDVQNQFRYGNYATERGLQDQAAGRLIAGVPAVAQLPQLPGSTYAQQVAALLGKYAQSNQEGTQVQKQGLLGSLLNAGAQAAATYASMGSDRRLKREITKIGELDDGLGVYIWRYIWGKPAVGVMADEVAELRPWALGPVLHGFATVDYRRI